MRYLKVCLIAGLFVTFSLAFAQTAGPAKEHGFDPADLDRTAKACVDFDQFANGGWKAKNPIPAAYPSWGSFNVLAEHNRDVLHEILDETAKNTAATARNTEKLLTEAQLGGLEFD